MPTVAMRNGDFRGLIDSQGRLTIIYDPLTTNPTTWARQPLSYNGVANTIDPARISPVGEVPVRHHQSCRRFRRSIR